MSAQESGGDPVARLAYLQAQLRVARAEKSLAILERQAKRVQESSILWDQVGAYGDLLDRLKTADGNLLLAPSTVADRRYGANWPHWRTWQEHSILRAQSRFLATVSDLAFGAISGLASYVVGDGVTHLAVARKGKTPPPSLVDACNVEISDYVARNDLQGLEQENFKDSRTDGEAFTRDFVDDEGRTETCIVLPEQIMDPANVDLDTESFGLKNAPGNIQRITHFYVCYDGNQSDGEWVPKSEMTHLKVNVGRTVKRGMPDLVYDTHAGIKSAGRCVANMVEGAAIQASIAEIRQHEAATAAQVNEFVDGLADYEVTDPTTGNRQNNVRATPGTVRDIPKGLAYVAPPFSQGGQTWISIVQSALRKVGVRWNAPEWLTSGDASNNNYASSLVAESPFHRRVLRWQGYYSRAYNDRVKRALRAAADAGRIRAEGRTWTWAEINRLVEVTSKAPNVTTRDPLQEAQRNSVRVQAGVLSVQSWAQEDGLDYEQEQQNIEAHNERTGGAAGGFGDLGSSDGDTGQDPLAGDPFAGLDDGEGEGGLSADADSANTLRATVGGSQAIADLQKAVYAGELPREAAIANATIVFGFAPAEAEALFPQIAPQKTADDGGGGGDDGGGDGLIDVMGDASTDLDEAVRHDKRGHVYCIDDSTGKRTACGPGETKGASVVTHQAVYAKIRAYQRQGPLTMEHVADIGRQMARLTVSDLRALNKALYAKAGANKRHKDLVAAIKKQALGADARTLAGARQLELGQTPQRAGAAPEKDEVAIDRAVQWARRSGADIAKVDKLAKQFKVEGKSKYDFLAKIKGVEKLPPMKVGNSNVSARQILGDYYDALPEPEAVDLGEPDDAPDLGQPEPAAPPTPPTPPKEPEKPAAKSDEAKNVKMRVSEKAISAFFGSSRPTDGQLAAIASAVDGSSVEIVGDKNTLRISSESGPGGAWAERILQKIDGKIVLKNDTLTVPPKSTVRGHELLRRQVEALRAIGVDTIVTQAGGGQGQGQGNGYYTWPRLGYDGEIPKEKLRQMPREIRQNLGDSRSLLDLMSTPEGRQWWKDNGVEVSLTFDVRPQSRSSKALDAYVQQQSATPAKLPRLPAPKKVKYANNADRDIREFFGAKVSMPDVLGAACAVIEGATISAITDGRMIQITAQDDAETISADRVIERNENGDLICKNSNIEISEASSVRGYQVLASQVESLRALGVKKIKTYAAGEPGKKGYNGYYTWPRLGYDGAIFDRALDKMPDNLRKGLGDSRSVLDLFALPGGPEWWKENGHSMAMEFDLAEGSKSSQVLEKYIQERAKR